MRCVSVFSSDLGDIVFHFDPFVWYICCGHFFVLKGAFAFFIEVFVRLGAFGNSQDATMGRGEVLCDVASPHFVK